MVLPQCQFPVCLGRAMGSPGMSTAGQVFFTVSGLPRLLRSQALSQLQVDPGFKSQICGSRTVSLPSYPSLQLTEWAIELDLQAVGLQAHIDTNIDFHPVLRHWVWAALVDCGEGAVGPCSREAERVSPVTAGKVFSQGLALGSGQKDRASSGWISIIILLFL